MKSLSHASIDSDLIHQDQSKIGGFDYSMNRLSNLIDQQKEIVKGKRSSINSSNIASQNKEEKANPGVKVARSESKVTLEIKNIMSKPVLNSDIKRAEFDIHGEPVTDFNQTKKLRPKQIKRNPD